MSKIITFFLFIPFFVFSIQPSGLFADIINDISADQTFTSSMNDDGTTQQIIAGDGTHFSSSDYDIPEGFSVLLDCAGACSWNVTESASEILGRWSTEGNWTFVNLFGIHIGEAAHVDVSGSLVLATLSLTSELNALNQVFEKLDTGGPITAIINEGAFDIHEGGKLVLLSERIENRGTIQATLGQVLIGAGEKLTLSLDPEGWISLVVDRGISESAKDAGGNLIPAIHNLGTIQADGGRIDLSARALHDTLDLMINNEGLIEAQEAVITKDGVVAFVGGRIDLFSNGKIANAGIIRTNLLDEHGYTFDNTGTLEGGEVYLDNIDGAANISGNIGSNISDTGNINVTGNVVLTNDVTLTADSDNSGGGDFNQQAGTSINGANKNLTIRSGSSAASGTGHVQLGTITNVNQLNITAGGGNIAQIFGSISARNISFAAGGNVALAGSITANTDDISVIADSDGNGAGILSFANGTSLTAGGCNGDSITLKGANSFTYGAGGNDTISSNGGATNASLQDFRSLHVQATGAGNDITIVQSSLTGGCTGTFSFEAADDITFTNNFSFASSRHLTLAAGGLISALGNFTQSNGTVTVNANMDVDGSFIQSNGTFNAPAVMNIGNDFLKTGGIFNHRNGKVIFDSPVVADIDVNGAIDFWDFESMIAGKTLRFGANDTFNILSNWTIAGAPGTPMTLTRFGGAGLNQWNVNAANANISDISVSHSNNTNGTPITPIDSIDGGNNTNLVFPAVPIIPPPGPPLPPDADPINAQLTPGQTPGLEGVAIEPGAIAPAEEGLQSESRVQGSVGPQNMFVGNLEGLQVFNANATEPLKTFHWNEAPASIRSSENGERVYAILQKARELLVIDSVSLEVKRRIGGLAEESTDVAVSPAEDTAYVPSAAIDAVQVVDLEAGKVTKTFPTGSLPSEIIMSESGTYLFVSNQLDKTISKINVGTGREEAVFRAGESPLGMVLVNHDQELFVTDTAGNTVLVFGTGIQAVGKEEPTGPSQMIERENVEPSIQTDVTPVETTIGRTTDTAVSSPTGSSEEANRQAEEGLKRSFEKESSPILMSEKIAPYQLKAKIQVGNIPYAIQADREGKKVFVSNRGSNSISVIDAETKRVIAEIPVGKRPSGIAVEPGGERMFVANELSGSVSSVDLSRGKVIDHIPAGVVPSRVLFHSTQKS